MKFRIWSNKHNGWWRPHAMGYTPDVDKAGEFRGFETLKILLSACNDIEWDLLHEDEPKLVAVDVDSGRGFTLIEWSFDEPDPGDTASQPIIDEWRQTA